MHRRPGVIRKSGATSSRIRVLGTERKAASRPGRAPVTNVILNKHGVDEYRRTAEQSLRSRMQNMDDGHLEGLERLQTLAEDDDFDPGHLPDAPNMVNVGDILDGSARIEISHAGGEFGSLEEGIEEDCGDDKEEGKFRYVDFHFIRVWLIFLQERRGLANTPRSHRDAQPRIPEPDARHGIGVHAVLCGG